MKDYRTYIESIRSAWIGKTVKYEGEEYKVVDADYNGFLLIDRPAKHTSTTAVSAKMVKVVK